MLDGRELWVTAVTASRCRHQQLVRSATVISLSADTTSDGCGGLDDHYITAHRSAGAENDSKGPREFNYRVMSL